MKQVGHWEWRSGPIAPVHDAMELCISYPDVVKNHSSCPALLSLQPGAGMGLVFEKLPSLQGARVLPFVPLAEEKQDKGKF